MSKSHLPNKLADLHGQEFIAALDGAEGHQLLEGLWRAATPEFAVGLVRPLAEALDEILAGLLVDEVLSPVFGAVVAPELTAAVFEHEPQLASNKVSELHAALDTDGGLGAYEPYRHNVECWFLAQPGRRADDWALDVLLGARASVGSPAVLERATARRARKDVAGATCRKLLTQLNEDPRHEVWQRAADFVVGIDDGVADKDRDRLLTALIEQMPVLGIVMPSEPFAELVGTRASQAAIRACEAHGYVATAFSISAFAAVDRYGDDDVQRQLLGLLLGPANQIWVQGPQTFTQHWGAEDWDQTLEWVLDDEWDEPPLVDANLVNLAPPSSVTILIEVVVRFADAPGSDFISRGAEHVAAAVASAEPEADPGEIIQAIIPWNCADDAESAARLSSLLRAALGDGRIHSVVLAFEAALITATQLVWLLDPSEFYDVLTQLDPGDARRDVATVMVEAEFDAAADAISRAQSEDFEVDLAEAIAEQHPSSAFAGLDAAWASLREDEKDAAVALLCAHATPVQLPLLELVIGDKIRKNAARRQLAVEAIGKLVPRGQPVPDCVVELLTSVIGEHRRAAAEAVAEIAPADVETVRKVRKLAEQPDLAGEAARDAVERLAASFISSLREADEMNEIADYLTLIGATGVAGSVTVLVGFIGAEAEYDDTDLRRSAAAAVKEVASHAVGEISLEDHEKLSDLIDGPEPEVDPEARNDLRAAVARISLGEDEALSVLYELIDFDPRTAPDALYGNEKESLVRHLGLYAKERDRGEAGWPGALMQLDLVSERLARAAYMRFGSSEKIKEKIQRGGQEPDLGALLQAFASSEKLNGAGAQLSVLHGFRCSDTDYAHDGATPTEEIMTTAVQVFRDAAKILVGALSGR